MATKAEGQGVLDAVIASEKHDDLLFSCYYMLLAYFIFWAVYFRRPSLSAALWLAILPSVIFILRGVIFRHWLLTAFGVVFAVGHICITWYNNRSEGTENE